MTDSIARKASSWEIILDSADSKVHGANMVPIWGQQDPGGPRVGPMNLAIWVSILYRPTSRTDISSFESDLKGWNLPENRTLIPAWMSNPTPTKVWYEITYPYFNGLAVEVW